jgi:hypothetical protein
MAGWTHQGALGDQFANPPYQLVKMDFAEEAEYRQQIKTFRLKYIFLAGKIIKTARIDVMKLSEKYPYREMYEKSVS